MNNNKLLTKFYDQYLYVSISDKTRADDILFRLEEFMDSKGYFAPVTTGEVDRFLEELGIGSYFLDKVKYYVDIQMTTLDI